MTSVWGRLMQNITSRGRDKTTGVSTNRENDREKKRGTRELRLETTRTLLIEKFSTWQTLPDSFEVGNTDDSHLNCMHLSILLLQRERCATK